MRVTSTAFAPGALIPARYTCDGLDVSPPLTIHDIPASAVTLVLVMDDPDAPGGTWDHWLAYDVPVRDEVPEAVGSLGTPGKNSWRRMTYRGPCPPSGTHRYVFTVSALDTGQARAGRRQGHAPRRPGRPRPRRGAATVATAARRAASTHEPGPQRRGQSARSPGSDPRSRRSSARMAAASSGSAWSQPQRCRAPCVMRSRSSSAGVQRTSLVCPPRPASAWAMARSTETTMSPRCGGSSGRQREPPRG